MLLADEDLLYFIWNLEDLSGAHALSAWFRTLKEHTRTRPSADLIDEGGSFYRAALAIADLLSAPTRR
jgi:hypothetical protein